MLCRSVATPYRWALFMMVCASLAPGCASQECDFHSQCGPGYYCRSGRCGQECRMDFDCAPGEGCNTIGECVVGFDGGRGPDAGAPDAGVADAGIADAGARDAGIVPTIDAGHDAGRDAGIEADAGTPSADAGSDAELDAGSSGTGQYLDRCATGADCASGRCVDDVGGSRMCSIACSTHRDCASEHVCDASGTCVPDDTGLTCGAASECELELCAGNPAAGVGHCTRPCASAADCPAGYACANAGGTFLCVDVEKPCSGANDCGTGLCLEGYGCTSACRSAADCPRRFGFFAPYTCEVPPWGGDPICVPPGDILGSQSIGASCVPDGFSECRGGAGACDAAAPLGPMCTQSCTQEGGCAVGLGCFPSPEDLDGDGAVETIVPLCSRAGTLPIGAVCSTGRVCASGLCDTAGYCTRLCTDDGLCPSDMDCRPIPGFGLSLCRL